MSFERIMGINVIDDQEYQRYRAAMLPMLRACGGDFGFDFRVSEVLLSKTDDDINRVFTLEFPSKQVMDDFFSSPDYIVVRDKHFKNSVKSKTVISMHEKNV